jgi:hypothetical protein
MNNNLEAHLAWDIRFDTSILPFRLLRPLGPQVIEQIPTKELRAYPRDNPISVVRGVLRW